MRLVWEYYRTGFQNDVFAPGNQSEAFDKIIRVRDHRSPQQTRSRLLVACVNDYENNYPDVITIGKNAEKPCQVLF